MSLTKLFCEVDDFCTVFEPLWHQQLLGDGQIQRCRAGQLKLSEVMTIVIHFHQSYRGKRSINPTLTLRPPARHTLHRRDNEGGGRGENEVNG